MRNNRHARTTIIIVTIAITAVVTSLFVATMIIVPRQANALSIYDPDAANSDTVEEKIKQPLEDDYTTTKPTVNCAMDTIESLQSFLSCLDAK
jgi:hypothetical protein